MILMVVEIAVPAVVVTVAVLQAVVVAAATVVSLPAL